MTRPAQDTAPPEFPEGIDGWGYLRDCYAGGWSAPGRFGCSRTHPCDECGACYRRYATVYNPVAFAVTYLSHLFIRYPDEHGRPVWSFSPLHLDMAEIGRRWALPGEHRDIVVGPRDSAKSIWWIVIVVWAMAHGHRRFPLVFSYTREQVTKQLADVREALESPLLLADFPELAPRPGRGSRNTMHYVTLSGAAIMGAAMKGAVLGARAPHGARPDCFIFDDAEPEEDAHNPAEKIRLLGRMLGTVLPMNIEAACLIIGTTTMPGSITHDGVRALQGKPGLLPDRGQWVARQRFRAHHWPAILDEGTDMQRSLWPQKWSLARLLRLKSDDPYGWATNYACDPTGQTALRLWTPEGYRYAHGLPIARRALSIDGAVTRKATSDLTGIVVGGQPTDPRKVVIEHAEQGRITGLELRERVWSYAALYPRSLTVVMIEVNQGGDRWREVLEPFPPCVEEVIEYTVGTHKRARVEGWHKHYHRGAVLHGTRLPELEDQQCAWQPHGSGSAPGCLDDLLDAGSALTRYFLTGWPGDGPALTVAGGQARYAAATPQRVARHPNLPEIPRNRKGRRR